MFYYLFLICLLINFVSTQENQCFLLNNKLTDHNININIPQKDFLGLRLCQGLIPNYCCPQIYENQIQNATAIELYRLFELNIINLYSPLIRLTNDLNSKFEKHKKKSFSKNHFF
jgi:hypothetical protein